jgi:hypothetical protein
MPSWGPNFVNKLIFTAILILKILFLTHSISKRIKVVGKVRASVQAKLYEIIINLKLAKYTLY